MTDNRTENRMRRIGALTAGWFCLLAFVFGCATKPASAPTKQTAVAPARATEETPTTPTPRNPNPNFPVPWWTDLSKMPDSWYRSAEGRRVAENILSWQDHGTGWPLMNTTREPFTGDVSKAGPWGTRAAMIKATVNEMRFLARGYRATRDERYRVAVLGALKFILDAQYPSGGWPHSYPVRTNDYSRYAAFNDDMMPDVMTLLKEVASSADFEFVEKEIRQKARQAFDKGVQFILKSQIRANGKLTAWCQQHDEVTYEPRAARKFEPVAISGSESASVLLLLMSIDRPSPEVTNAIEAGVQWYHDVQINGVELIQTREDRIVRANPSAPPLWARFYEIDTSRPIFAGRDGVIRYNLADIDHERRLGYSWYNRSGIRVFARYDEWRHAQKWHHQPPANTDEASVRSYKLPDPLEMADGSRVTSVSDWEQKRRPEILKLFEQNQHGITPSNTVKATFEIVERGVPGMGGLSRRTQARIRFADSPDAPVIRVVLNVPATATGPVPTLLHIGFSPNVLVLDEPGIDEGMAWSQALKARVPDREARLLPGFDPKLFVNRGYGIAMVYYGDIDPDFDHGGQYGVRSLFGTPSEKRKPDEWGAIGAWAWGLSRILDYLQTEPAVDGKQVALSGVSRLGKTVLWAAAQDQRFAMAIPMLSGEGGAAISRRNFGETVADLTNPNRFDYWYAPRYADYAFDVDRLPVDGHMLVSLIAPRPVLLVVGSQDNWSDPRGEFLSAKAAELVYALYGRKGLETGEYPAPDTAILNDMGFFLHQGGHATLPVDLKTIADFMDKHFSRSSTIRLDIGANAKRNDTGAVKWREWPVDDGSASAQLKVGGVTVTLRPVGAVRLHSQLSKIELAVNARLACDGVFVKEPTNGGALEVVLQGLPAGPHAVTTYHNSIWPGKSVGQYRVSVVGIGKTALVTPPKDVKHDDDIGSAHLSFVAPTSGDVIIRIEAASPGDANNIVLNGLAIDGEDPQRQARKPAPADRDEHADGDSGNMELAWTPARGARAHRVYVSRGRTAEEAVNALSVAAPASSLLVGMVNEPRFSADIVDHDSLLHYAWRVDEVGADNVVTPGLVWTFRVRHLAFPGAEGYGRFAIGGRGGCVFRVTNLDDSGPGSLREAVEANEPRTVVFEVGGLISLKSRILIRNPYITIAGQTAPGKGICVRNYSFGGFGSHDIIKRFVRIRLGDLAGHSMDGTGLASCDHSIFDHLSISWTLDEAVSTRGAGNITLQRTIISEALLNAPKYSGGYAGSIGGDVASLHHNLLSHNAGRNWSLAGALDKAGRHQGRLDIRNNVVYNWYKRTTDGGAMIVQFVNNYYKPGPASVVFHVLMPERNHTFGPQDYYVSGNIMEGKYGADDAWAGIVKPKNEELNAFIYPNPFFEPCVTTHTATEAFENVLADVGCNEPMLDEHDQRIISETRNGTSSSIGSLTRTPGVINTQQDVGGWEEYPEVHRPEGWDTDGDGIPNAWETDHGLNPSDAADGARDRDGDGYTALEDYLASLVRGVTVHN